jgi:hypothetical protein
LAFWTASIESVRIVLMHSSSSFVASDERTGVLKAWTSRSDLITPSARGRALLRVRAECSPHDRAAAPGPIF